MIIKCPLRCCIQDYGFLTSSGDHVAPSDMFPFKLYGIQELNYLVGDFFGRALYSLTRGYKAQSKAKRKAV